jgi:hypothetical protein
MFSRHRLGPQVQLLTVAVPHLELRLFDGLELVGQLDREELLVVLSVDVGARENG